MNSFEQLGITSEKLSEDFEKFFSIFIRGEELDAFDKEHIEYFKSFISVNMPRHLINDDRFHKTRDRIEFEYSFRILQALRMLGSHKITPANISARRKNNDVIVADAKKVFVGTFKDYCAVMRAQENTT